MRSQPINDEFHCGSITRYFTNALCTFFYFILFSTVFEEGVIGGNAFFVHTWQEASLCVQTWF